MRVEWNGPLGCFSLIEHSRGQDYYYKHIEPNQQTMATVRALLRDRLANHDPARMLREMRDQQMAAEERENKRRAEYAGEVAAEIASGTATPTFAYNSPRIGEHPRKGLLEELERQAEG